MNRGRWHIVLVSAIFVAACFHDDSYRGREHIYANYETPLDIKVAVGDPYLASKGTGPVDSLLNFKNKDILVWAFGRIDTTDVDYRTTVSADSLLCLMEGKEAELDGVNSLATWKDEIAFYPSGENCARKYDFYAAYVDDAVLKAERRGNDLITRDYTIDGSQDLMVSKAQLPITKESLIDTAAFSYVTALKGEDPVFTMNHCLTRIDLYIRPGVTNVHHYVRVHEAALRSRTTAKLTVAAKNEAAMCAAFDQDDPYEFLYLSESDGSELEPVLLSTILPDSDQPEEERLSTLEMQDTVQFHRLGGSFFVSPEKTYKLQMDIRTVDRPEGDVQTINLNDVKLKDSEATFKAGNRYIVYMTIFGSLDVTIHVEMVPWYYAGSFYLDPDADTEITIVTDADHNLDADGYFVMKEGEQFDLNADNNAKPKAEMTYVSSNPSVLTVSSEGVLEAQALPDGVDEATARITIESPPSTLRPDGGYKIVKVKVKRQ